MNKSDNKFSAIIKAFKISAFTVMLFFMVLNVKAQQYNAAGSAIAMTAPGCYSITDTTSQAGAVWNSFKINLSQPFDITLTLNFGNRPGTIGFGYPNCGADGMSFILQPLGLGVFGPGGGVGFNGITPSLGVVMDSYPYNYNDPSFQHISIHKNGNELHGTPNELKSYTTAVGFPSDITDGLDHLFRFSWIPTVTGVGTINVYFGNATTLPTSPTITYTGNVIDSIFSGNPNVYWGVGGSTGGCYNVQTVCMTTVSNFACDTANCAGIPVTFTNNSMSGFPITSYLWDFGDSTFSTLQNPTHTFNNPGTYDINLEIINSVGLSSTMTHAVVVHPPLTILVNNDTICKGDTAILSASGASSYTWDNGLTPGALQKVSPAVTTSYIVTGINSWGCSRNDTALVIVNILTINAGTDKINICGDTSQLDSIITNYTGNDILTYTWYPNTGLNSDTIPNPETTVTGITYTITVHTSNGCIANDSVSIVPIPLNNPDICIVGVDSTNKNMIIWNKTYSTVIDSFLVYRETNVTGIYEKIGAVSYDSNSVFVDYLSNPNIQSNKYKIAILDNCGIESAKSVYHKTMHLAINQSVATSWNLIWELYEGFTVSTYNIYRGTNQYNLQLIDSTSGGNNQYTDFSAPSGYVYYQVEVISPNNCNITKSINSTRSNVATNNPTLLIESAEKLLTFSIYPNPSTKNITIEINNFKDIQNTTISIYAIQGQLLMQQTISHPQTELIISQFAKGVYVVKVHNEKHTIVSKFVKE